MKGRLRSVKINTQQRSFASFNDEDFQILSLLKGNYNKFILEICSGTGDFLVEYAKLEPTTFFLGVDYAENAFLRALKKSFKYGLVNCKFRNDYIQNTIDKLLPEFFDIVYINFPDPWPKKRHASRRLVTSEFISRIYDLLKQNGFCIIITDNKWYQEFIDSQLVQEKKFQKMYDFWYTEDQGKFLLNFNFFPSNYYNKAKLSSNIIRYYVLHKN